MIYTFIWRVYSVDIESYFQCAADSESAAIRLARKAHGNIENPAALKIDSIVLDGDNRVI